MKTQNLNDRLGRILASNPLANGGLRRGLFALLAAATVAGSALPVPASADGGIDVTGRWRVEGSGSVIRLVQRGGEVTGTFESFGPTSNCAAWQPFQAFKGTL